MSIQTIKLRLIEQIMNLEEEDILTSLEKHLDEVKPKGDLLSELAKPMRKTITVEGLVKEQNYVPMSREEFYAHVEALDIDDPLEELLAII